jgi:hypothetical protein
VCVYYCSTYYKAASRRTATRAAPERSPPPTGCHCAAVLHSGPSHDSCTACIVGVERDGSPVARQLAPMISKLTRTKWDSHDLERIDDERRQILEEAAELDHMWGAWAAEPSIVSCICAAEPTNLMSGLSNHP